MSAASDLGEYILGLELPPSFRATLHAKAQAAIREATEGQLAGEEWRALNTIHRLVAMSYATGGFLTKIGRDDGKELDAALAAVERSRSRS